MNASTCASLNQRSNLLLLTCHLHSLCEDAPVEGPEWAVGGGGLFLEQHAWVPHRPLHSRAPSLCLCLCQLPELPLPLQFLMAPLLSSPSAGDWGFEDRARGFKSAHWEAIFKSALTINNCLPLNPVRRGLRELLKIVELRLGNPRSIQFT